MNLIRYIKYYMKETLLYKKYYKKHFDKKIDELTKEINRIDEVLLILKDVVVEIKNQSFKEDFHLEHKKNIMLEVEKNWVTKDLGKKIKNLQNQLKEYKSKEGKKANAKTNKKSV